MGLFKSKEDKAAIASARAFYDGVGAHGLAGADDIRTAAADARGNAALGLLSDRERLSRGDAAFARAAELVLADDILDSDEEQALLELAEALGIDQARLEGQHRGVLMRLMVARVNDGRLRIEAAPRLMTKKGETVHLEADAALLKEVAVREYQGGYSGVSFQGPKGVRYHTGGSRGRSVVVGTRLETADVGVLSISSMRAVFMGGRKTIEFAYPKLVNLDVFTDGVRFHVSNRQTAHLLQVESGDVIAAYVNAAAQRLSN